MIPSLDVHLLNLMGFRNNIRSYRSPNWAAWPRDSAFAARDFLLGAPGKTVLRSVELPRLPFSARISRKAI